MCVCLYFSRHGLGHRQTGGGLARRLFFLVCASYFCFLFRGVSAAARKVACSSALYCLSLVCFVVIEFSFAGSVCCDDQLTATTSSVDKIHWRIQAIFIVDHFFIRPLVLYGSESPSAGTLVTLGEISASSCCSDFPFLARYGQSCRSCEFFLSFQRFSLHFQNCQSVSEPYSDISLASFPGISHQRPQLGRSLWLLALEFERLSRILAVETRPIRSRARLTADPPWSLASRRSSRAAPRTRRTRARSSRRVPAAGGSSAAKRFLLPSHSSHSRQTCSLVKTTSDQRTRRISRFSHIIFFCVDACIDSVRVTVLILLWARVISPVKMRSQFWPMILKLGLSVLTGEPKTNDKLNFQVQQRDVPGIDAAYLAMDTEEGVEVVWNEVKTLVLFPGTGFLSLSEQAKSKLHERKHVPCIFPV